MTHDKLPGASLRLTDLVKNYGQSRVVDGVSLNVNPGEFVTFLGPSGSGKTTTLNMIAGFARVTDGQIDMDDTGIVGVRPHKRNIGMVFQHYALFPHMTVARNIGFPLKQRRHSRRDIDRMVQDALALVRLDGLGERYPRQLSGGQQQRVALARALVFKPRLLLMDEPLGALDKNLRESLQVEIKRIHREVGISFIYVTHDQEEALALSDRIAVFNAGQIEQIGDGEELYERPDTLFVAEFLGESNRICGKLVPGVDGPALQRGELTLPVPPSDHSPDGRDVVLVLRPEHLRVGSNDTAGSALRGQITEIRYLGSSRKVEVRLDDGDHVVVREQSGKWGTYTVGDRIAVTYPPNVGSLFPSDSSRSSNSAERSTRHVEIV